MDIEIKEVNEVKTMEIRASINGDEKAFYFKFDEKDPAGAEIDLNGQPYRVDLLRKIINAFVDRYPLEFEK